jgi:hypothetical protein
VLVQRQALPGEEILRGGELVREVMVGAVRVREPQGDDGQRGAAARLRCLSSGSTEDQSIGALAAKSWRASKHRVHVRVWASHTIEERPDLLLGHLAQPDDLVTTPADLIALHHDHKRLLPFSSSDSFSSAIFLGMVLASDPVCVPVSSGVGN